MKKGDTVQYLGGYGLTALVLEVGTAELGAESVKVRWSAGGVTDEYICNLELVEESEERTKKVVSKLKYKVGDKVTTDVGGNPRLAFTDGVVVATKETTDSACMNYDYQVAPESDPEYIRWFYEVELTPREEPATVELDAVLLKATEDIILVIADNTMRPSEAKSPVELTLIIHKRLTELAEELRKGN